MVRKTLFTREDVIAAGVAVLALDGLGGLSARRVAEEMGASTAPVYSNFANMEEFSIAVKREVTDQLLAYTTRAFTDNAFLNIGVGILEFAREKPKLYSAIFMQDATACKAGPRVMAQLAGRMATLPGLVALPLGERLLLLHQLGVFTHGLAVRICNGLADDTTITDLIILLREAGDAMIQHALSGPERSAEQAALIRTFIDHYTKETEGHD